MSEKASETQASMDDLRKAMDALTATVSALGTAPPAPPVVPAPPAPAPPVPTQDLHRSMGGAPYDVTPWITQVTDNQVRVSEALTKAVNANIDQTHDLGEEMTKALVAQSRVHSDQFSALVEGFGALQKSMEHLHSMVDSFASQQVAPPQSHQHAHQPPPAPMQQLQPYGGLQPPDINRSMQHHGQPQHYQQPQQGSQAGQVNVNLGGVVTSPENTSGWNPSDFAVPKDDFMRGIVASGGGVDTTGTLGAAPQQYVPSPMAAPFPQPHNPGPQYDRGAPNGAQQHSPQHNLGTVMKALEHLHATPGSGVTLEDLIAANSDTAAGYAPRMSAQVQNVVARYLNGASGFSQ